MDGIGRSAFSLTKRTCYHSDPRLNANAQKGPKYISGHQHCRRRSVYYSRKTRLLFTDLISLFFQDDYPLKRKRYGFEIRVWRNSKTPRGSLGIFALLLGRVLCELACLGVLPVDSDTRAASFHSGIGVRISVVPAPLSTETYNSACCARCCSKEGFLGRCEAYCCGCLGCSGKNMARYVSHKQGARVLVRRIIFSCSFASFSWHTQVVSVVNRQHFWLLAARSMWVT